MKTLLITFFNISGIVHLEFIPQGQTFSQAYYVQILKRLREAVRRTRPELWSNDWILHYDNASAHKTLSIKGIQVQKSITEKEQPSFSPDLTPNDCWLFPKIETALKGRSFRHRKIVTTALKGEL
jgi:hypothetical protein